MLEFNSWIDIVCVLVYGLIILFVICFFIAIGEAELDRRRREKEQRKREELQRRGQDHEFQVRDLRKTSTSSNQANEGSS